MLSRREMIAGLVLPNLLTIARLALAVAFPIVPPEGRVLVIVLAALSDAGDGAFSRLLGGTSTFGQVLDPIADKFFVAVVLVTLLVEGPLTVPQLLLVGARDLAVVTGCVVAVVRVGWHALGWMPPHLLGKAATAMQFSFLLFVVYDRSVPTPLLALTGVVSVAAGIDYLRNPHWKVARTTGVPDPDDASAELQHPQGDRRS